MTPQLLLGNDALARGMIENGCRVVTAYPGTPSSEILAGVVKLKKPADLRVNTLKSTREKVLKALAEFGAEPCLHSPIGIRVPAPSGTARTPNLEAEAAFQAGWCEIQDEGSQLAALLAGLLAQAQQPAPFFLIQLTDPQIGMYTGDKNFLQETANLEFAIATANRLRPAFVVVTGDRVNKTGDPMQIAEYLRITGELDPSIKIYHVAGNHDVGNVPTAESLAAYRARFGADYYSFRHQDLVGLHDAQRRLAAASIGKAQVVTE